MTVNDPQKDERSWLDFQKRGKSPPRFLSLDSQYLRAALGYFAITALVFHRVLIGDVLSPAANLWVEPPFRSQVKENLTPYLNGIQGDVWREFEPWHAYQYRAARAARFPLWNPHIFAGFPSHANAQ